MSDSGKSESPWLSVFAPASVANVGPGFDCFGFSLGEPGDIVRARISKRPGVRIVEMTGTDGSIPMDVDANTAGVAAKEIWEGEGEFAQNHGLELMIEKGMPSCSGLGSSAASAVGGALAAMIVATKYNSAEYDQDRVLHASVSGEAVASGARHADNVAPCLLGGFILVQQKEPLNIARFQIPMEVITAIVTPNIAISTKAAREALPKMVPLEDAITNWANAASLVLAMSKGDEKLLAASLHDTIVEPCRAKLIPGFDDAKKAAIDAGAFGCSISGSGPTLFALAGDRETATAAADAIEAVFSARGMQSTKYVSAISKTGARRI